MLKKDEQVEMPKKEDSEKVIIHVVDKLPIQEVREGLTKEGIKIRFVTITEYLTELANQKNE